jgi:hypothetical protein
MDHEDQKFRTPYNVMNAMHRRLSHLRNDLRKIHVELAPEVHPTFQMIDAELAKAINDLNVMYKVLGWNAAYNAGRRAERVAARKTPPEGAGPVARPG